MPVAVSDNSVSTIVTLRGFAASFGRLEAVCVRASADCHEFAPEGYSVNGIIGILSSNEGAEKAEQSREGVKKGARHVEWRLKRWIFEGNKSLRWVSRLGDAGRRDRREPR